MCVCVHACARVSFIVLLSRPRPFDNVVHSLCQTVMPLFIYIIPLCAT